MKAAAPAMPQIDVIIPCYNARTTLVRAVDSALQQSCVGQVWIVNDGSTDTSPSVAGALTRAYPGRVMHIHLPDNGGAARARNIGAIHARQEIVAFLDADDMYERHALDAAALGLANNPNLALVRLGLKPADLPDEFAEHPKFAAAWRLMEMTVGGNLVIHRRLLIALGGFPEHPLFHHMGGEDGALGIALHQNLQFGTMFGEPGIIYQYRAGAHAERLMRAQLFGELPETVTPERIAEAEQVTQSIATRIAGLRLLLAAAPPGAVPLTVEWGTSPGSGPK